MSYLSYVFISGLTSSLFFLGMFYRSASLYHPLRRAILHLKVYMIPCTVTDSGFGHGLILKMCLFKNTLSFRNSNLFCITIKYSHRKISTNQSLYFRPPRIEIVKY